MIAHNVTDSMPILVQVDLNVFTDWLYCKCNLHVKTPTDFFSHFQFWRRVTCKTALNDAQISVNIRKALLI